MLSTKSGKYLLIVGFDFDLFPHIYRENHLQVSLLVIDKKTNSKRKKKSLKISSSDPNVVLLYSEKMNPINEAEILEVKNNLKNISESDAVNEPAPAVHDVDVVDAKNEELKNISTVDARDKETFQDNDEDDANTKNNVDFDFPDNNSLLNETVEELMGKRQEEGISSSPKNEKQEEVDSVEVIADEAEEEILDEELTEVSEADTSFKTASSTASISSTEKVSYFILLNSSYQEARYFK